MSDCYLGEIRMFTGNYAPQGWALCNGQLLPIANNQALFSLIGVNYGGDGVNTFALPDLRGRVPLHNSTVPNNTFPLGSRAGSETVNLTTAQMPAHSHTVQALSTPATQSSPDANALWAQTAMYSDGTGTGLAPMNPAAISAAGAAQPHNNMMPSLPLTFMIALVGIFPSRS
ncbi:phage tail protein [Paenibacillus bovis]|uniref:Phage tail protein n=1 Tax=Paenibacillus bovis TaxID=1616788 RepID=A0A172ZDM6_9BACL|nr:tail fiber protein [Paenibacillus bovis]ANF95613.1 phage tail protein [Paenibacillus bovis]